MEGLTINQKHRIMLRTTKFFGLMVFIFAMVSGCNNDKEPQEASTSEVEVREDNDGEWRIYDEEGINRGTWIVDEADTIKWDVTGSEMTFSFPEDMSRYFNYNETLFTQIDTSFIGPDGEMESRRIETIEEGGSLQFTIRTLSQEQKQQYEMEDVEADTIDYDIYVIDADKFVIGNSPPILIIRRSHN